jgi:D-3-phosphoglycerate dehydrogenase / 2-oxoglutarate reductase
MSVLGVTLARGGSKGIPKKNIKPINGKPLIAYTIEAALSSNIFDEYVVSTDSIEIAEIAKKYGALIPFMRPEALARDQVWSRDALKHAVLESERIFNKKYDYVIELPCTGPLRRASHIQEAFKKLVETKADSVTAVTPIADKHPVRMKRIVDDTLKDFTTEFPEGEGSRRQDLEPCYVRNGSIYAMTRDCIVERFSRHGDICRPYIMDEKSSINIDSILDFKLAEILINEEN